MAKRNSRQVPPATPLFREKEGPPSEELRVARQGGGIIGNVQPSAPQPAPATQSPALQAAADGLAKMQAAGPTQSPGLRASAEQLAKMQASTPAPSEALGGLGGRSAQEYNANQKLGGSTRLPKTPKTAPMTPFQRQAEQNAPWLGMDPDPRSRQNPLDVLGQTQGRQPGTPIQDPTLRGGTPPVNQGNGMTPVGSPQGMSQQTSFGEGQSPSGLQLAPGYQPMSADEANQMYAPSRFKEADKGMPQGFTEGSYQKANEELKRAAFAVTQDQRFNPEQRKQALDRIAERQQSLVDGYAQASPLMQSPAGSDNLPAEEYSDMQQTGLVPMANGTLKNPATGDVLRTMRAENGQMVPVPSSQYEIDSLPPGTNYMDSEGKIQSAKPPGQASGSSGSKSSASASGSAPAKETKEELFASYQKWEKGVEPFSTTEELAVVNQWLGNYPDDEKAQIMAEIQDDPAKAFDTLAAIALPEQVAAGFVKKLETALQEARVKAFKKQRDSNTAQTDRLGKEFGIEEKVETKPALNPDNYVVQVGNRGTARVYRRGSELKAGIPAVQGEDGQLRPAPGRMNELGDLEANTDFVNVRPGKNGGQVRTLPFGMQTVNTGDFALNDQQRKAFKNATSEIAERPEAVWNKFEASLRQFSVTNEPWDPSKPTPAQSKLQAMVHAFYPELAVDGKAMMTMHIAHALGYKVAGNGLKSTGWATRMPPVKSTPNGPAASAPNPASSAPKPAPNVADEEDKKRRAQFEPGGDRYVNPAVREENRRGVEQTKVGDAAIAKEKAKRQAKTEKTRDDTGEEDEAWRAAEVLAETQRRLKKAHQPDRKKFKENGINPIDP